MSDGLEDAQRELAGASQDGNQRREARLLGILCYLADLPPAGADLVRLEASIVRSYSVSHVTASGYLEDLRRKGWVRISFGTVRLTSEGLARIAEAARGTIA